MTNGRYLVNEWFYSLQGEGVRMGEPSLFLRFSKCNMECRTEPGPRSPGGFDCDTEFESGRWMQLDEIVAELHEAGPRCEWVVLTGGEPALQVDATLIDGLHAEGYRLAIETNGSVELPQGLDWVTVSPKVAEHAIRQRTATEVKIRAVLRAGRAEDRREGGALLDQPGVQRHGPRCANPRLVHRFVQGASTLATHRPAARLRDSLTYPSTV